MRGSSGILPDTKPATCDTFVSVRSQLTFYLAWGKNIYVHCVGVDHPKQAGYKIAMYQLATFVSAELNVRYMCDYDIWLHCLCLGTMSHYLALNFTVKLCPHVGGTVA